MNIKLFVGVRLTPELKQGNPDGAPLIKTRFEGREYWGLYLEESAPSMHALQAAATQLIAYFQHLCPHVRQESLTPIIFPQFFVG